MDEDTFFEQAMEKGNALSTRSPIGGPSNFSNRDSQNSAIRDERANNVAKFNSRIALTRRDNNATK